MARRQTIGRELREARQGLGLSLRELETRSGVSNALISQIETGHVPRPSFQNIVRLARELRVPITRLADMVSK